MKEIKSFLDKNELTDIKFELILSEVLKKNPMLANIITLSNWEKSSIKILERILDIYNNSRIDIYTGEIIELNME